AAEFVVLVGQRRQPQGGDQRDTLLVDAELVQAAFITVKFGLQSPHHALGGGQRGGVGQLGQVDEQDGEAAQLGQPGGLAGGQPAVNGRRNEGGETGREGVGRRGRRPGGG